MISGKVVWLTGASSGIGFALAEALLLAGNQVIASARNTESLERLAASYPNTLSVLACDVSDEKSVASAHKKLEAMVDMLDLVILNAGTCEYVDLPKFDADLFRRVFATNIQGVVNCIALALPFLTRKAPSKSKHKPHLVAVSSLSSLLPFPRAEAYGASKAALDYLMATLRIDLQGQVDVTVVQPGFVKTPLTAKNDFAMPGLIDCERAVAEIIWAIDKRKKMHRFPRRLAWPLLWLRAAGSFWESVIAPKLVRNHRSLY